MSSNTERENYKVTAQKFQCLEQRIDNIKFLIDKIITVLSLGTIIIGAYLSFNLNSEKAQLKEFKIDIKDEIKELKTDMKNEIKELKTDMKNEINTRLGTLKKQANIELFTIKKKALNNEIIKVQIISIEENGEKKKALEIPFIIKNTGESPSGEYHTKYYTDENIVFANENTTKSNESKFKYESYIGPEGNIVSTIPPGLSFELYGILVPENINNVKVGETYPMKVEIYYSGKIYTASFEIKIEGN